MLRFLEKKVIKERIVILVILFLKGSLLWMKLYEKKVCVCMKF